MGLLRDINKHGGWAGVGAIAGVIGTLLTTGSCDRNPENEEAAYAYAAIDECTEKPTVTGIRECFQKAGLSEVENVE